MKTSHYLLATEKETPKDAELISHQLMLRAGLIRRLAAGVYTWLPTGLRVLNKVATVVREEMTRSGANEVTMPCVIPAELWQETGRWEQFGGELLKLRDRHERDFCFGPTHEEVITVMARAELRSYKQLPINFFQIQTKFRDEIRPRFGVMRAREFLMKDAYSFHMDADCLANTYQTMYQTYCRIFERLGLQYKVVDADAGAIGGSITQEFHVLAEAGEDDLFYSDTGSYAANIEMATCQAPSQNRPDATQDLEIFDTPGARTIDALARDYDIPAAASVKTMIVQNAEGQLVACILRGDHNLNLIKASKLDIMQGHCELASETDIKNTFQASPGSLGPVNCPIPVVVDRDAAVLADFVCGANQDDKHYKGVNWERDVPDFTVADIRDVTTGDTSPDGKGTLKHAKGIEVGHIFQLGDKYSQGMNATVLNENGKAVHPMMGCYGLGVSRVIAAAIEQHHDENGILWPQEMAPFQVAIIPMTYHQSEPVKSAADQIYQQLSAAGIEVLLDDRQERAGVMFADMDLIGIPHQIVIGKRGLVNGMVEYKARTDEDKTEVALDQVVTHVQQQLAK